MEFVGFEAEVVDDTNKLELDYEEDTDKSFLDDGQQKQSTSLNFYRKFQNQSQKISDALNDRSDDNCKLDIRGHEKATKNFFKSLCLFEHDLKDSFYNAILYGLVFKLL